MREYFAIKKGNLKIICKNGLFQQPSTTLKRRMEDNIVCIAANRNQGFMDYNFHGPGGITSN